MEEYPCVGQPSALLIKHLFDRVLLWSPGKKIIYRDLKEFTYREFFGRVQRLASVLTGLGIKQGDKVGVLDWDSHRYLELFFAVPMLGAVLHTVNVRLSPEQTAFTIHHAADSVLFVHDDFVPLVQGIAAHIPTVRTQVRLTDAASAGAAPAGIESVGEYEALLAAAPEGFEFPDFNENTIATLFYTTGTTGDPKGVFFSHRQLVLHTLGATVALGAFREPISIHAEDVYMPLTPMFHVHGWGVPYIATMLGMTQVYPGRYEPTMLLQLIQRHTVSFSHCVPTIVQMLLNHPASKDMDFSALKLIIGGASLSKGVAQMAMNRGIKIVGGYGMSETCPIVAVSQIKAEHLQGSPEEKLDLYTRTGFPMPLVRAAAWSPDNKPLPPGPQNTGELVLQCPWLTQGYYRNPAGSETLWRGGWLHTGDIAYMDNDGYIRITDRLKDVVKIGGEWISSLELENALSQHPAVREVAVFGVRDPKWDEHPCAEVVLHDAQKGQVSAKDLLKHLHGFIDRGIIHKRAILTEIVLVDAIPKTSVGKIDKKQLRARHNA